MEGKYKRDNDLVEQTAAKIFSDKKFGRGNYSILAQGQDESIDVLIEPHKVPIQVVRAGSSENYHRRKRKETDRIAGPDGGAPTAGRERPEPGGMEAGPAAGTPTPVFQVCEAIRKKIEMDYPDVNSLVLVVYCEMPGTAFDIVRRTAGKISECIAGLYPPGKTFREIWCVSPIAGKEDSVCVYRRK